MKRKELINRIQNETGLSKREVRACLSTFMAVVKDTLANGGDVKIRDFGRFFVKERKEHRYYNIQSKRMEIMPKRKIAALTFAPLQRKIRVVIPPIHSYTKFVKKSILTTSTNSHMNQDVRSAQKYYNSNILSYPSSGGNMIIPDLAIGSRREMESSKEKMNFEYWGKVINGSDKKDALARDKYPFALIPLTGTSILACTSFDGVVNGVSEPMLYKELRKLRKIEPEIRILKNVSLPIKKRNYGYKPDIAIVWKSKGICIDVEIDEPYDILSREPIHYSDLDCNDYLRNAYFLENGWYVVRVAEEQVIRKIDDVYNFVSRLIYAISNDERFNAANSLESRKRWTRDEAIKMAQGDYREGYLGLHSIKKADPPTDKEDYNKPESFDFICPNTDIIDSYYGELKERLKVESGNHCYFRIKQTGNGYEYVTPREQIQYSFHGISLYDVIEDKEYYLPFSEIDSFIGLDEIKIEKDESQKWHYFIRDAIVHCRPVHFLYNKTSESGPTERTVLHLTPYITYNSSGAQKYLENHTRWEWLNGVSWHMYRDLCNRDNMPEFTGYCSYREGVRTFNALRIIEGFAYDCYKPLARYDTDDVIEVLDKGDGKLAGIIYSHFTDEEKSKYFNIANNAHALVMQGRIEEALKQYGTYSRDYVINNDVTWGVALLEDIDAYISKDIHKPEFEKVKEMLIDTNDSK